MKAAECIGFLFALFFLMCVCDAVYRSLVFMWNSDKCAEVCFPNAFDMLDFETCSCWLPDGTMKVTELE